LLQSTMARIAVENSQPAGPPRAPDPDAEIERSVAENLKIQQYLRDYPLRNVTVSEAECEEYYRQHLEDYVRNDVVHVREILVDDRSQAEKILSSLKQQKNKNFGELARVYSKAPSAADGGDLGIFQRGDLPENLEKVVFRLAPTMVSPIVQTRYGYHIFLLEEKILAHQQKFYEVKDDIQEKLLLQRERDLIAREVDSLMKQIPVEIRLENLDFKYLGNRLSTGGGTSP
jgi:parvulin-like peptidyl-prolyl isomerase